MTPVKTTGQKGGERGDSKYVGLAQGCYYLIEILTRVRRLTKGGESLRDSIELRGAKCVR